MKTTTLLLSVSSFTLILTLCPAHAQNLILGFNPSYYNGSSEQDLFPTVSSSFTVGANDIQIMSVGFLLNVPAPIADVSDDTAAYIFSDSGGLPGATVGSVSKTFAPGELFADTENGGFTDFTFTSPLTLSAGNTYWIGFGFSYSAEYGLPNIYFGFENTTGGFEGNGAAALDELNFGGQEVDPQTLLYQLDGYVVPEPSTMTLSVAGAAMLLLSRRIFRQPTTL